MEHIPVVMVNAVLRFLEEREFLRADGTVTFQFPDGTEYRLLLDDGDLELQRIS